MGVWLYLSVKGLTNGGVSYSQGGATKGKRAARVWGSRIAASDLRPFLEKVTTHPECSWGRVGCEKPRTLAKKLIRVS